MRIMLSISAFILFAGCVQPTRQELIKQNSDLKRMLSYYEQHSMRIHCDPISPDMTAAQGYRCHTADKIKPQEQHMGNAGFGEHGL